MKSARENMDMVATYFDVGSYRGAAELCGTTHKTVIRAVARHLGGGEPGEAQVERARNYDVVAELVTKRIGRTRVQNLTEAVAARGPCRVSHRFGPQLPPPGGQRQERLAGRHHRGPRPEAWSPGETLIIDWGSEGGLHIFCAVSA